MTRAAVDRSVEGCKPGFLEPKRRGVVLEPPIVNRNANDVEADACHLGSIGIGEEHLCEPLEKVLGESVAEHLGERSAHERLGAGETEDVVLQVQPAAETDALELDGISAAVDELVSCSLEEGVIRQGGPPSVAHRGLGLSEVERGQAPPGHPYG